MKKSDTPRKKTKPTFENWVNETGIKVIAEYLEVHPLTITNWLSGLYDPRCDQMRKIKRWTKGAIGYDEIIDRKAAIAVGVKHRASVEKIRR